MSKSAAENALKNIEGGSDFHKQYIANKAEAYIGAKIDEEAAINRAKYAPQYRGHLKASDMPKSIVSDKGFGDANTRPVLQVMSDTGLSKDKASALQSAVKWYSSGDYQDIRKSQRSGNPSEKAKALEEYIAIAPKWNGGKIYRGINVSASEANKIISDAEKGTVFSGGGTTSWSSSNAVAKQYAGTGNGIKIMYRTSGTKLGTSIRHLSKNPDEDEVAISQTARWKPTGVKKQGGIYIIDCQEISR